MISAYFHSLLTLINIWCLSFLNSIEQSYKKYIIWFYPIETISPIYISDEEQFIQNIKPIFLELIKQDPLNHSNNINPIFYEKKCFTEYMKNPNTKQERIWKTRIQMITTPRGNIIMYYDAYKLGFAYYCDQNVISYDILNSCAMKYVMTYNCRDFFIDEVILPEDTKNPLKVHYIDEKKSENSSNNQSLPFMKPKQNINKIQHDKLRNKFIYLGNMRNFSPCQPPVKKTIKGFASVLLDNIDSGMNWSSYKKQMIDKLNN